MKRPGYLVSCTETLPNVASGTVDHTCLCSVLIIALCTALIPILQVRKLRLKDTKWLIHRARAQHTPGSISLSLAKRQ